MVKNLLISISILSYCINGFSQNDSTLNNLKETSQKIKFSAYLETYYTYDLAKPQNHIRQSFSYSHNRNNEVNINLGIIKVAYQTSKIRANLALMAGTYSNENLASEPGVLKNIYEANVGIKLSKQKNLWLDAGIMNSHIGFESAIGKDCWTLTRSIMAENSPYYETGAKVTFKTNNNKWLISGLILNGWQRTVRPEGNNTPAFGHQLKFTPNSIISVNSSSFIGNDKTDKHKQMRYFHHFHSQFEINQKIALIAGFDIGSEQKYTNSNIYNIWYSPILILKYKPIDKHSISLRGEYYNDKNNVIVKTETINGFQTWGCSINYDYYIEPNIVWRIEARGFTSKDEIFRYNNSFVKHNLFFTTSLAISF